MAFKNPQLIIRSHYSQFTWNLGVFFALVCLMLLGKFVINKVKDESKRQLSEELQLSLKTDIDIWNSGFGYCLPHA